MLGLNILGAAASVIPLQTLSHQAATGRTVNGYGDFVTTYAAATTIRGSIQPVDSKAYVQRGLDATKVYYNLYTDAAVQGIRRESAGDLIRYGGVTCQCVDDSGWAIVGEWRVVLLVVVTT
jgi:hypothetical protein